MISTIACACPKAKSAAKSHHVSRQLSRAEMINSLSRHSAYTTVSIEMRKRAVLQTRKRTAKFQMESRSSA
eukprot:5598816-Pleurochrysis_carterae.AAC.2